MDYPTLQHSFYVTLSQCGDWVMLALISFLLVRIVLRNKKVFRLLSCAILLVPFMVLVVIEHIRQ